MIKYGLTIENQNLIIEKAKSKKDGVYSFRGVDYRVRNKIVTHFAASGQILERCFGFNVIVGSYEIGFGFGAKKILKEIKEK